jgi:hypothetical protein
MLGRLVKLALLVMGAVLFVQALPDIKRYLQIRKM